MTLFWRKKTPKSTPDPVQQARARHPSTGGYTVAVSQPVLTSKLGRRDWAQIDDLLSKAPDKSPASGGDNLVVLQRSLGELRSFMHDERIIGATHARDWLLDLWSVAQEIDAAVARPAEVLLTRLVGRDLVSSDEIRDVCDSTERLAMAGRSAPARADSAS
jgi:hypothetical protein